MDLCSKKMNRKVHIIENSGIAREPKPWVFIGIPFIGTNYCTYAKITLNIGYYFQIGNSSCSDDK